MRVSRACARLRGCGRDPSRHLPKGRRSIHRRLERLLRGLLLREARRGSRSSERSGRARRYRRAFRREQLKLYRYLVVTRYVLLNEKRITPWREGVFVERHGPDGVFSREQDVSRRKSGHRSVEELAVLSTLELLERHPRFLVTLRHGVREQNRTAVRQHHRVPVTLPFVSGREQLGSTTVGGNDEQTAQERAEDDTFVERPASVLRTQTSCRFPSRFSTRSCSSDAPDRRASA